MSEVGKAMFKGAAIGGAAGAVGGGIYGGIKAKQKIESLPTDTVTLNAHQKPIYEKVVVATGTEWDSNTLFPREWAVTGNAPKTNPDGTFQMQEVPAKEVTGHGKAIVNTKTHDIKKPEGINVSTYNTTENIYDSNGNKIGERTHVVNNRSPRYVSTGKSWTEPTVKFETGISTFGHIVGYAAAGAAVGAVGGALVGLALQKASA